MLVGRTTNSRKRRLHPTQVDCRPGLSASGPATGPAQVRRVITRRAPTRPIAHHTSSTANGDVLDGPGPPPRPTGQGRSTEYQQVEDIDKRAGRTARGDTEALGTPRVRVIADQLQQGVRLAAQPGGRLPR